MNLNSAQRHVVFVGTEKMVEIDLLGPLQVFQMANEAAEGSSIPLPYAISVVSTHTSGRIAGECGIEIASKGHYSQVASPIDTLLVVAGKDAPEFEDQAFFSWLRTTSPEARRTGSICVGAFVLAAAGLLSGRKAATHWAYAQNLREKYPDTEVDAESIWVKSEDVYTSAGVCAGIDLALALVEEDLGSKIALHIARMMVVFLKRPGGQQQFSVALKAQMPAGKSFADLAAWVAQNLDKPLSVELLSDHMAMSPRNFARVFREETGVTPARYVRQARMDAARIMLEQTRRSMDEIAALCGFGSDEVMRRAFVDEMGVSPVQYRAAFETGPLQQR